ncbi:sigma-54-dependent transcriptional regulator [Sandaracinobacter neustonicus]|uniref:sigma-54-dependent transcriptional regulator n=1 Tax=Sandaracinobacter neustonicus TaxID=1715348 RepID=UPI001F31D81A|nr:response regulator [Sandaracinobacter neustonicus]
MSGNGQSGASSSAADILLVDDNPEVARAMAIALELAGHRLEVATNPEEAFSRLATHRYRAILLDMNFTAGRTGGEEGIATLQRLLAQDPSACVVVITAHSGVRIAVAAMQAGARDFLMKPWRNAELVAKVEAAMLTGVPAPAPATATAPSAPPAHLLGESPAMAEVRRLIARMGPTAANILISGPPGSGRGLVARALHAASPLAAQPLAEIDLRDDGAWAALEGAEGAVLLRHADRIGEIPAERLLRRLPPNLRVFAIVAETAPVSPALRARIGTVEIPVPPLSARATDALILARHFAREAALRHGRPAPRFTPAAEALILSRPWPDEVRGLALAVERALLLSDEAEIDSALLAPARTEATAEPAPPSYDLPSYDLDQSERLMIAAALAEHGHNISHAAAALGLSRGALYRRMARHGL